MPIAELLGIVTPASTRAGTAEAPMALSILAGFLVFALVITAMMGTFLDYFIGVMHELIPLK